MTETEYIDATNLAKMRIAYRAVADCLFMEDTDKELKDWQQHALIQMGGCVGKLEKRVDKAGKT